jgi:hypothetical protein
MVKGFDHIPEPSAADLEEEDEPDDFDGSSAPHVIRSPHYEANQREYEANKHAPDDDDDSRRAALHRNARDQSRIEHDTNWALISKAGSFLTPKGHRDKERDRR